MKILKLIFFFFKRRKYWKHFAHLFILRACYLYGEQRRKLFFILEFWVSFTLTNLHFLGALTFSKTFEPPRSPSPFEKTNGNLFSSTSHPVNWMNLLALLVLKANLNLVDHPSLVLALFFFSTLLHQLSNPSSRYCKPNALDLIHWKFPSSSPWWLPNIY